LSLGVTVYPCILTLTLIEQQITQNLWVTQYHRTNLISLNPVKNFFETENFPSRSITLLSN